MGSPAYRREPAFCTDSIAYSEFRRGLRFLNGGHPAQAAMFLSRALEEEPGRNSIREALGRAQYALGRPDRAAELFEEIVGDRPDDDYAHYALACSLRLLGREDEARGHLRLARALSPQCDLYRDAPDEPRGPLRG